MSTTSGKESITSNISDFTVKVKEILESNGITHTISEVIVKDAGLMGEGFASQTKYITVNFQNPNVKPLNLFAKVVTSNESHNQMLNEFKAFEKEARFLTDYVPTAEEMCKTKGLDGLTDLYPKCYYGDETIIVLENLVLDQGYCLLSKEERQDLDAAKFAIQTLAKHHAISYAMIKVEGGPANFFKRFPNLDHEGFDKPFFFDMMGPTLTNALKLNIRILENNEIEGKAEALEFLNSFKDASLMDLLASNLKYSEDEILVLGHGDYWNNNMMFLRDKETNKIIGHKAVDLQVTRYNSPVLDLSYYMFTSVKTDVRQAHLKELLELYLDTLKKVSNDLGHPIPLTYDELFLQFRRKLNFGFWFIMWIINGPGMKALNSFDVSKIDIKDWATVFHKLMQKWIDENPGYAKVIAEEVVKVVKEYKELSLE